MPGFIRHGIVRRVVVSLTVLASRGVITCVYSLHLRYTYRYHFSFPFVSYHLVLGHSGITSSDRACMPYRGSMVYSCTLLYIALLRPTTLSGPLLRCAKFDCSTANYSGPASICNFLARLGLAGYENRGICSAAYRHTVHTYIFATFVCRFAESAHKSTFDEDPSL